ncbi:30S ribosomal protein THX [Robertkochia solimangrovi]|nr:30S ribosomal protein THX [Robertkochia solimangrovi]TRZ41465.1 30S ribosomal protein THX [Robertkochia solimangrovi]
MGKGDLKSKRGKISRGTYGVRRRRKLKKRAPIEEKVSVDTKK